MISSSSRVAAPGGDGTPQLLHTATVSAAGAGGICCHGRAVSSSNGSTSGHACAQWQGLARTVAQSFSQAAAVGQLRGCMDITLHTLATLSIVSSSSSCCCMQSWSGSVGICNGDEQQRQRQGNLRGCVGIPQHMLGLLGRYL